MVTLCLCLLAASNRLEYMNNHHGGHSPHQESSIADDNHHTIRTHHQDHTSDGESHLNTPLPFSPLHIPQFTGSMGFGSGLTLSLGSQSSGTCTSNLSQSKSRGASDCPGVCPLCGATLRQARNLRRHLLSSCKYRLSAGSNNSMQNSANDSMMMEIKPEVEISGYNDQSITYGTDSGSNSCEHIICKPSLPSPPLHGRNIVSSPSSIPSPTIAR